MFPEQGDTAEDKMSKGCNCGDNDAVVVILILALLVYAVVRPV
jgi:hypothetical protein